MRIVSLVSILCVLFFSLSCQRFGCYKNTPEGNFDIAGRMLHGKVEKAYGALAQALNSEFVVSFDAEGHFHIQNAAGIINSTGSYFFFNQSPALSSIILRPDSGAGAGEELRVKLSWKSDQKGNFDAEIAKGQSGSESGTFYIE